jgi:hypothetical protein
MLTDHFSASFALTRHRGTPFCGYLDGFTEWLAEQGYKDEKIRVAVQNVTALGIWLPDDVASQTLDEDVLGRYDAHLRRIGRFKHASGRYFLHATPSLMSAIATTTERHFCAACRDCPRAAPHRVPARAPAAPERRQ